MSVARGGKFSVGNPDEDFSSDESSSSSSGNSSLDSKSDSENSSSALLEPSSKSTRTSLSSSLASISELGGGFKGAHQHQSHHHHHHLPETRSSTAAQRHSESCSNNSDCDTCSSPARTEPESPVNKHPLCLSALANDSNNSWTEQQDPHISRRALHPSATTPKTNNNPLRAGAFETKTSSGLLIRPVDVKLADAGANSSKHILGEQQVGKRRKFGLLFKMYSFSVKYYKEICIILFMLATGLPFLRSKPLKTRAVQTPGPFFSAQKYGELVEDHYQGEYVDLVQNKIPKAPSFVLYYAPWDSECLAAKSVFLDVARHFKQTKGSQVKFYAVNCWWPDGQCRQNYKNLSHYPIFVAHINGAAGIIYNGPVRAELMIRFLNLILQPVSRIDTEDELWRFRAQHDAVMLAYFNFSIPASAASYDIYLQMALRNLEADPLGQVGYGVFLRRPLAEKYFVTTPNAISLVLFNEIHTAKWHGGFPNQDMRAPIKQVADWVMERTKTTPVTWAYRVRSGFSNRPVTLGPMDLAEELSKKPIVLVITRRYYPSAYSPFYAQVKEVALDYFNCNKSGNVTRLRRYVHKINSEWLKLWKSIQKICQTSQNVTMSCEIMMEQLDHWKSSGLLLDREPLTKFDSISSEMNFTGLSCRSNETFRFIAIDPADVPHFVNLALGGVSPPVESLTDQEPLGYIIDAHRNLLVPLVSFKTSDIARAIYNYTMFMNESAASPSSVPVVVEAPISSGEGTVVYPTKLWVERRDSSTKQQQPSSVIEKLNAVDFLNIVEPRSNNEPSSSLGDNDDTPLFIMYTAQFCGYCGIALAQFVSLARFLQDYNLQVRLARIDVFRNSLPSHLTVGDIPSFLFFPSNKSDVRIFPPGEEITTINLLKFLLSELSPRTRVELSFQSPLCSDPKLDYEDEEESLGEDSRSSSSSSGSTLSEKNGSWLTRFQDHHRLGPEDCQFINKKLVTQQISSVLRILRSSPRDCTSAGRRELRAHHNHLQGLSNEHFNGDKFHFLRELRSECFNSNIKRGKYQQHQHSLTRSQQQQQQQQQQGNQEQNINGTESSNAVKRSPLVGEDKALESWSHKLLDHLRSMRIVLDTY